MVKIIDLEDDLVNHDDAVNADDGTTEEEDDGIEVDIDETPPEPPEPPDHPPSPDTSSALEPLGPGAGAGPSLAPEGIQQRTFGPGIIPPPLHVNPTRYLWNVIAQYGHYVESQRPLRSHGPVRPSGPGSLSGQALELQQLASPPNSSVFTCSITAPQASDTPEPPTETALGDNREPERGTDIHNTETVSHTDEDVDKNECKIDSDDYTKEKSNGLGEKVQLAATAKADLRSSSDLSEYELSDMSDSHAPPDYDTLQVELNAEYTRSRDIECTTSLTQCPWTTVRETCMDLDPENSMDEKEPSEYSEQGEAACLPANSIVKDCWEQWVDDDRLFNLAEDIHAPSTSAGVRMPSPGSPATERRRVKFQNRQKARERERAPKPVERSIFVPTEKIGRILGKGGRRIREIERTTGANIKVQHRQSNKPVTQLIITGSNDQISKAEEEICLIIRNFKPPKSGEAATVSVSSQEEMEIKRLLLGIKDQVLDGEQRCSKP